ncbi:MAG: hypothetical protein ACYDCO_18770 [Armatimonadota bacterium]
MRCWVLLLCVLGLILRTPANDADVRGEGGRIRRLSGEHSSIRMVREYVRMDVYQYTHRVCAEFHFRNEGPATRVKMGFPEWGSLTQGRNYRNRSMFYSFKSWVDGQQVAVRRTPGTSRGKGTYEFQAFWVKTVSFARNQARTVRVEYTAENPPVSEASLVLYDFTGGNWKDTVGTTDLVVHMHTPGTYLVSPHLPMTQSDNRLAYRWVNWEAENHFQLIIYPEHPEAYQFDYWGSGTGYLIKNPGKQQPVIVPPPVMMRQGRLYILLSEFITYADHSKIATNRMGGTTVAVDILWDDKARSATLRIGDHTYAFTRGESVMTVDDTRRVILPGKPFRKDFPMLGEGDFYVPLRPLVEACGGTWIIDQRNHRLTIHIPGIDSPMPDDAASKQSS